MTPEVSVESTFSKDYRLNCGIPQRSVLRPYLYAIFSKFIGKICRKINFQHNCYADDTQAYLVFKPDEQYYTP